MTIVEWRQNVDELMMDGYCIDTADAGCSGDELESCWKDDWTPKEFVEWFAQKYDLNHRSEFEWGNRRRG